jgi:amidase
MPATELADLSAADLVRRIASGGATARQAVEASLERIERLDRDVNAFSVVIAEQARSDADRLDRDAAEGASTGPLHGVPVAIKEEIDVAGCVTTFGGRGNSTPAAEDGEVVRRLREAGAVVIGKTRMPEFGQWPFTESVDGGITRNPWDHTRTPGGSSGGTAVAVALGMVPVGIGGDGGGSIRIPAACCGLFGLKPTRGRVTADPMPHLWWALGTTGPLTRTVLDSALVYDVIRGNVSGDRFTAPEPSTSFAAAAGSEPGRLRIGWSTKPVTRGVRPAAEHVVAVHDMARLLGELGHDVREVDPHYPDPTAAFVPQFFAGVRTESDGVEHFDRLERRTRQVYRLQLGPAAGHRQGTGRRRTSGNEGQPRVRRARRPAHPDDRTAASRGRRALAGWRRDRGAALDADDRVDRTVERHRQPGSLRARRTRVRRPAAGGPARGPDG